MEIVTATTTIKKDNPDSEEWKEMHQIADEQVPEMMNSFLDIIDQIKDEVVLAELERQINNNNTEIIMEAINWDFMENGLTNFKGNFRIIIEKEGTNAIEILNNKFEFGISFDIYDPNVVEWINDHSADMITLITDESKDAIRETIRAGYQEGYTNGEIAKNIKSHIGLTERQAKAVENLKSRLREAGELTKKEIQEESKKYSEKLLNQRSMTIAQNETMTAAKQGTKLSWEQAEKQGVINNVEHQREWIITPDDRLCPYCAQMIGDRRFTGLNEPYDTPLGQKQVAHMHVGCRCAEAIVRK